MKKYGSMHSGIPTPNMKKVLGIPFHNKQQYSGEIERFL